jgi:imidazolonepropionase-like amidohydrolase
MSQSSSWCLAGATVIDVAMGQCLVDRDVLIRDGRIEAVGPSGTLAMETDIERVDAAGRYVIPGLIDMHSHALDAAKATSDRTLMLTFGVTSFRQMGGSPSLLKECWVHGFDQAGMATPLAIPGEVLTPFNAGTPDAAVAEVRRQGEAGADFIKVGLLSPGAFEAALHEASHVGLPFVGHLPAGVNVRVASVLGMACIEHLGPGVGVLAACSLDVAAIRDSMPQAPEPSLPLWLRRVAAPLMKAFTAAVVVDPTRHFGQKELDGLRRCVETFDEHLARDLARDFVRHGTWNCPTLIRQYTTYEGELPEHGQNPALRYIDRRTRRQWDRTARRTAGLPTGEIALRHAVFDLHLRLVGIFEEEGVRLLAGSDASGAMWDVPGDSLQRELVWLCKAGLTPLRALQTATLDAAEFLGVTDEVGVVAQGRRADLLVLERNPLEDIANVGIIVEVVSGGCRYPSAELDLMRRQIEQQAPIR